MLLELMEGATVEQTVMMWGIDIDCICLTLKSINHHGAGRN